LEVKYGIGRGRAMAAALFSGAALLAAVVNLAAAQTSDRDAKPVEVVRQKFAMGDESRYKLDLKLNVRGANGGQAVIAKMQFKQTCSDVKPTGAHTLTDVFEAAGLKMASTPEAAVAADEMDMLASLPVVTLVTDAAGAASISFQGGTDHGNADLGGILQQFAASSEAFRPPRPVKVGDKWKLAYANANKLIGAGKIDGDAELLGTEAVGTVKTLKIHIKAGDPPTGDPPKPGFEGIVNLDPATGRVVKLTQKGSGEFAGGSASVELTITLVDSQKVRL